MGIEPIKMVNRPDSFWEGVRANINQVAGFLSAEFKVFDAANIERKGLHDLVSFVDRNAEIQLREGLLGLDAHIGFWGEEGGKASKEDGAFWLVDPLDGTTNFMHGIPHYAISVALIEAGEIVAGFVQEVERGRLFEARVGKGAYCQGRRIGTSNCTQLEDALIATGFPVNQFEKATYIGALIPEFMQKTRGLRRFGSAALDLVHVAEGRYEAFYEFGLKPWDVAAGALIVTEAGGAVCSHLGDQHWLMGPSIVASSSAQIQGQMLQLLNSIDHA
jgi:myo-inositol-1(or 4)-monophosphatase